MHFGLPLFLGKMAACPSYGKLEQQQHGDGPCRCGRRREAEHGGKLDGTSVCSRRVRSNVRAHTRLLVPGQPCGVSGASFGPLRAQCAPSPAKGWLHRPLLRSGPWNVKPTRPRSHGAEAAAASGSSREPQTLLVIQRR